jgi:hypothetical protein
MDAVVFGAVKKVDDKVVILEGRLDELESKIDMIGKIIVIGFVSPTLDPGIPLEISQLIQTGVSNFLIKSIQITASSGEAKVGASIITSRLGSEIVIYENSVTTSKLYDVVDLPYTDADAIDSLHMELTNKGTSPTTFSVRIVGIASR